MNQANAMVPIYGQINMDLFSLSRASEVVLDCGATESAGGIEAIDAFIMAVKKEIPGAEVYVDATDKPWFRFASGEWGQARSRVHVNTPIGKMAIYVLDAQSIPDLGGHELPGESRGVLPGEQVRLLRGWQADQDLRLEEVFERAPTFGRAGPHHDRRREERLVDDRREAPRFEHGHG